MPLNPYQNIERLKKSDQITISGRQISFGNCATWSLTLLTFASSCNNSVKLPPADSSGRPNIIFIMSDDHAYQAISCYGSKIIQTPNIDRIAREGVIFQNSFVTNSICAPSRAVMLTGKYSHMNGLRDNQDVFNSKQQTYPALLRKAGYFTAMIGKWHLKNLPEGFDYWNVLPDQGDYYNPDFIGMNGDTVKYKGYATDLITDMVIEQLDKRNKNKPFCILYHNKAPHRNWMPAIRHLGAFSDSVFKLPETFYDDYSNRSSAAAEQDMRIEDMFLSMDMKLMPGYYAKDTNSGGNPEFDPVAEWSREYNRLSPEEKKEWDAYYLPVNEEFKSSGLKGKALIEWKYSRYMEDYLGTLLSVDENIGRLLDYLDKNGLAGNTILVYTSDQGFYLGEHGWYDKRFMYEQSLRMPLVMRYPKEIKAGQVNHDMVLNLDFAPTFLDFAGVEIPGDIQGNSFRKLITEDKHSNWRNSIYYHYYEFPQGWHSVKRHYGIRTEKYKLIHFYNDINEWELFDLENDSLEINNLYQEPGYAAVVVNLKQQLDSLRSFYGDTLINSNDNFY